MRVPSVRVPFDQIARPARRTACGQEQPHSVATPTLIRRRSKWRSSRARLRLATRAKGGPHDDSTLS